MLSENDCVELSKCVLDTADTDGEDDELVDEIRGNNGCNKKHDQFYNEPSTRALVLPIQVFGRIVRLGILLTL